MYTKLLAQGAKFDSGATVWTALLYSTVRVYGRKHTIYLALRHCLSCNAGCRFSTNVLDIPIIWLSPRPQLSIHDSHVIEKTAAAIKILMN